VTTAAPGRAPSPGHPPASRPAHPTEGLASRVRRPAPHKGLGTFGPEPPLLNAVTAHGHGTRPWQPTAESGSIRVDGPCFAGPAARVLAALRAAPRAIAPRAMTSLNATTSSKGIPRSRKLRIAAAPIYRRGALQPITSTWKVRPWLPAVAIDVDPRQFLRVSTRPRPGRCRASF
jgi:hypothetical protein